MGQPNDARFAALCIELARLIQEVDVMERDLDWLLNHCQEVEVDAKKAETKYHDVTVVQKKHVMTRVKQPPPSSPIQEVLKPNRTELPLNLLS